MKNTYRYKDYYIYFTSQCLVEAFHVHSGKNKTRAGSIKLWVREDGSTKLANDNKGRLSDKTIRGIQGFIANNYMTLYNDWLASGGTPGFYKG